MARGHFLAQNFFAVQPETPRHDGGRGLWLKGDGQGGFMALPGQQSGVKVYGEQRGLRWVITMAMGGWIWRFRKNGAATKLYRNVSARPGLRIRLVGPPKKPARGGGNPAVAVWGAARSGQGSACGIGLWSQDSAVQVLGKSGTTHSRLGSAGRAENIKRASVRSAPRKSRSTPKAK